MDFSTVIICIILCLGALQGIVYGVILFRTKSQPIVANRILAIILLLLSYRLLIQVFRLFGIGYYDWPYYFMIDLSWIHGALIYFYVKAQLESNFRFKRKDWFHFIPVIFQICFSIFVRVQNLYWDGTKESLSWLGYWGYVVWMNNSTIYIVASILIIVYAMKSKRLIDKTLEQKDIQADKLAWLKRITLAFTIYFGVVLAVLLIDLFIYNYYKEGSYFYFVRFYYYPFFIGIALLTYWIGLEGFSRRNSPILIPKIEISMEERIRLQDIARLVEKAMVEKQLFKNQDLSLNAVAIELDIKPYLISKSLNEIFSIRFNDYINEYRVKEIQSLLQNPENSKYTLLGLAMEAGFNSKSSFNRAIKKHLGISPNQLKFKS